MTGIPRYLSIVFAHSIVMETLSFDFTHPDALFQTLVASSLRCRIGDWLVLLCLAAAAIFQYGSGKMWFKPDPLGYLMYIAPQSSGELNTRPKRTRNIGERLRETVGDITSVLVPVVGFDLLHRTPT